MHIFYYLNPHQLGNHSLFQGELALDQVADVAGAEDEADQDHGRDDHVHAYRFHARHFKSFVVGENLALKPDVVRRLLDKVQPSKRQ